MDHGSEHADGIGASATLDGRIVVAGGMNALDLPVSTVEVYTPATNTWATATSMPTARWSIAAATFADGRIFAIGGSWGLTEQSTAERPTRRERIGRRIASTGVVLDGPTRLPFPLRSRGAITTAGARRR